MNDEKKKIQNTIPNNIVHNVDYYPLNRMIYHEVRYLRFDRKKFNEKKNEDVIYDDKLTTSMTGETLCMINHFHSRTATTFTYNFFTTFIAHSCGGNKTKQKN